MRRITWSRWQQSALMSPWQLTLGMTVDHGSCGSWAGALLGKNIWGAWPLIIWEATMAKQNYCRTNYILKKIGGGPGQDLGGLCPPRPQYRTATGHGLVAWWVTGHKKWLSVICALSDTSHCQWLYFITVATCHPRAVVGFWKVVRQLAEKKWLQ